MSTSFNRPDQASGHEGAAQSKPAGIAAVASPRLVATWDFDIEGLCKKIVAVAAECTGKEKHSLWELLRAKDQVH